MRLLFNPDNIVLSAPGFHIRDELMQNDAVPKIMQQSSDQARGEDQGQPEAPSHDGPHRDVQRHADDFQGAERAAAGERVCGDGGRCGVRAAPVD